MTLRTPLLLGTFASALVLAAAVPASAATVGSPSDTTTTFTLAGGDLTLAVQGTATLTPGLTGATAITGSLGAVSVTDERGGTATWAVSAVSSAFTGALATPSSSTTVSYTGGTVTETGTITVADGAAKVVDTSASVVAATSLSGNNTASWAPTLDVTMPAGALADTYSGTVTTSIL